MPPAPYRNDIDIDTLLLVRDTELVVPPGRSPSRAYRVNVTQNSTGGWKLSFAGQPVRVISTPGATTFVELQPAGEGYVVSNTADGLVEQVTLTAPLAYTLPAGTPAGSSTAWSSPRMASASIRSRMTTSL